MFKDIKKFFSALFKNLKRTEMAKFTPVIAVICLLAILIPTLIAVWHVYFKENEALASTNDVSVILYDGEDNILSESSAMESNLSISPLVDVLYNLYLSKVSLASAPELPYEQPNYKVKLLHGDTEIKFSCYFTEKHINSYILDSGNNVYAVDSEYYVKFLDLEYSDAVYSSATPPTLMTKDGDTVVPYLASWSYKKLDGTVNNSNNFETTVAKHTYSASGSIGLTFSKTPDFCSVEVTDSLGKEVYHGDLSGLSAITAAVGERLAFSVEAEWTNNSTADSFGSIKYNFELLCRNLASFSVSNSEVRPGGYFIITAFDVEDTAPPTYTPDTSIKNVENIFNRTGGADASAYLSYIDALDFLETFTPAFFKDGTVLKAIVPIPYNTPQGEFIFSLSSGVATSTHKVRITDFPSSSVIPITNLDKSVTYVISKQAVEEAVDLAKDISVSSKNDMLARGEFLSPLSLNYTLEYSYGDRFILGDIHIEKLSALGNAYLSSSSDTRKVLASNIGIVLKIGYTTHLGTFAVIDHGCGLLTWYCNLSDVDVREGDVVAKGDQVGKSGSSLLLDGNGVLILCSLNGTFIDPSLILGKEILYTTS